MPLYKLIVEQAQAIYDEYANDFTPMATLAKKFGVHSWSVSKIWTGEIWGGKINRWWHNGGHGKKWGSRAVHARGWT